MEVCESNSQVNKTNFSKVINGAYKVGFWHYIIKIKAKQNEATKKMVTDFICN